MEPNLIKTINILDQQLYSEYDVMDQDAIIASALRYIS
jgi:hypothetical protein